MPLAACICPADATRCAEHIPPADTFGRLLLALLRLTEEAEGQAGRKDPRAEYYRAVCPHDCFSAHIACWDPQGERSSNRPLPLIT